MFHWEKIKNIFCPENIYPWMVSHAANPFPVLLDRDGSIVRVYFTCRDKTNRSHVGYVDVDFENQFQVIATADKPVISPGNPGEFDDSGAAMGFYLDTGRKKFIYYLGWNLKVTVPWQNSIGLALSEGNSDFEKVSRAPIIDRSDVDPYSISYPCVLLENEKFKMWYGSNLTWGAKQEEMNHVIKYAESYDGIHWKRSGSICIDLKRPHEYAISKPHVLKIENQYRMWYSYRASIHFANYKIGYAESADGKVWKRKDNLAGIDVSENGWDSEMICYPSIFLYRNNYYMLYNGNGYGKTGFGIAKAV